MPVYPDQDATTRLDGRVIDAMLPFLRESYGTCSSVHRLGRAARRAIDMAREQLAELVGAQANQVVFTSGATEANNLAIKGVAGGHPVGRMLIGAIEHTSVATAANALAVRGWTVDEISVDGEGRVGLDATEVVRDEAAVATRVRDAGARLHTDAVQAAGKLPVDFAGLGVHLECRFRRTRSTVQRA